MLEESVASAPSIWATMNSWFTPSVFFVLLNLMIGTIFITSSLSSHKPKEEEQEPHQQQQHQQQHQQHYEESPRPQQLARSPSMLQRLKSISLYSYRSQEPNTHFGKSPEMETHYGFLQQSPELGQEQEAESEKETPFLTRSPSMLDRLKSFNLYKYVSQEASFSPTHLSSEQPHEPEQHRAQAEEEEQVDPAGDEEPEEQEEQELEEVEEEEEEEEVEQSLDNVYSQLKENQVERTKSDTQPASGEIMPKLPAKIYKSASVKSAFAHFEEDDIVEARRPATTREAKGKASHEVDEEVDAKADDFINRFKQQLKLQRLDSFMRYKEMISRGNGK
ncbi:pathogen-associated molecular patterns-induced protein A70-like [Syzygium oleosum]|uniref:pathogen-associated molecular patterns-induced protein A70-like n=1 Tax=Syzygium oleosum TaxID=219896 RepID=UPI0024BBA6AA|nr:pathogen-associated molecular patterns-induced protein A70-like [Syzygium oleosum]